MSEPINEKEARLRFGRGSTALAHMSQMMEEHAAEIKELEGRFGNAGQVEPGNDRRDNTAKKTRVVRSKKPLHAASRVKT